MVGFSPEIALSDIFAAKWKGTKQLLNQLIK